MNHGLGAWIPAFQRQFQESDLLFAHCLQIQIAEFPDSKCRIVNLAVDGREQPANRARLIRGEPALTGGLYARSIFL